MEITYTLHGDYLLPDLVLPKQEHFTYGKYGMLRRTYLKIYKKILYTNLLTNCDLTQHLAEIDQQANERLGLLIKQMAETQCVTEEFKAKDQMAWIGAMNNIRVCAEEIILKEIVYC